jgi:hypothetical protein
MNVMYVGPSGLVGLDADGYPDLTVGAITYRRFAPHDQSDRTQSATTVRTSLLRIAIST